jgi:hypothetical protein
MPTRVEEVTLCCIDTDHPAAGLRATLRSLQQIAPAATIIVTTEEFTAARATQYPNIEFIGIKPFQSGPDYSRVVMKELGSIVQTSHALLIQWDGYVIDAAQWSQDFLNYDYIGAPWAHPVAGYKVGNGGFSLRSKNLLTALQRTEIPALHPEDLAICIRLRPQLESLGIKFADEPLAARFAYEQNQDHGPTFGFHGIFNLWQFIPPDELAPLMDSLPGHALENPAAAHLIRAYASRNRWHEAATVLRRIETTLGHPRTLAVLKNLCENNTTTPSQIRADIYAMDSKTRST